MIIEKEFPMRTLASVLALCTAVAGCSPDPAASTDPSAQVAAPAVETDVGAQARIAAQDEIQTFPKTMPEALYGDWREDDLKRAPTVEDCNQTAISNNNFGKVMTIRADGYSLFEDGGRIIEVHNRTGETIDATFDTTYADTPTKARRNFVMQQDGSLVVTDLDGASPTVEYRPCPK